MLRITDIKHDIGRMVRADRRPYEEVWHLWTIIVPRRSITGHLLWGTVWRRRDDGRWIYKKFVESPEVIEHRRSIRTLVTASKKANSR